MMFRFLLVLILSATIFPVIGTVDSQPTVIATQADEPYTGMPLCLPDAYPALTQDCLPLGPSVTLHTLAQQGIPYPLKPLPAAKPAEELKLAPDAYMKVTDDIVPVYPSLEAAKAKNASGALAYGRKYLAVAGSVEDNGTKYYRLVNGSWVNAAEAHSSCCIYAGRFQGLIFRQNPANDFGWIIDISTAHSAPSRSAPVTANLVNEQIAQVYATAEAENTTWYRIGVNQWVEKRWIRIVMINPKPPEGVDNQRWIEVNLEQQTLAVYENGQLQFATLVATGMKPMYTKPGLFKIYVKKPVETMSGSFEADRSDYYYYENVPFTMYFDEARALHGAYWRTLLGYAPQSHGCVNLSIGDARWLYEWANEGEWVWVWDPSGQTPTDPSQYSQGGA